MYWLTFIKDNFMKMIFRPDQTRIHKQDTWKKSAYAFVPYKSHFGELCGFAEDIVAPGQGFGMHPHQNMEISTILISGAQVHKDNTGSGGIIDVNCVQTMSAGTGIMHSEFNASAVESFHSFQIWVYPKKENVKPRHEKFGYRPQDKHNRILLAISPDGRDGTASINQDAFFSVLKLEQGIAVQYIMNDKANGVYIHCATGSISIEKHELAAGDALGIYEADHILMKATSDADIIFVEVPMKRGTNM
jgi:redox-sensitive bicupin YhaK (pirin superfamily)